MYSKFFSVPQANVTITKSRSGPVYAGTEFVLTADISLNGVNGDISLYITWNRGNDVIANDTRITVSAVSGSGDSYTASLTYSPINISDSGEITANISVSVDPYDSMCVTIDTATATLSVEGILTQKILSMLYSLSCRSSKSSCDYS